MEYEVTSATNTAEQSIFHQTIYTSSDTLLPPEAALSATPSDIEEQHSENEQAEEERRNTFHSVMQSIYHTTDTTLEQHPTTPTRTTLLRLPNEILVKILFLIQHQASLYACMLTSRRLCRLAVELLWARPTFSSQARHSQILYTLSQPIETLAFPYVKYIRSASLYQVANQINDSILERLRDCDRLERINLNGCKQLTSTALMKTITCWPALISLDLSKCADAVDDRVVMEIATHCPKLQNVYFTGCHQLTDTSLTYLASHCPKLKRIYLGQCSKLTDATAIALSEHCPRLIEIEFSECSNITDAALWAILPVYPQLRDLRLRNCVRITDDAFSALPMHNPYMRVLDLTSCSLLTDAAVETIVRRCPRLRKIYLCKCSRLTDQALLMLTSLGPSLHDLHLGHCNRITNMSVILLAYRCTHLRYLDFTCCIRLTDTAICELARLPRLRRLGLVRCVAITDTSLYAFAEMRCATNVLERVHLSYCHNLTLAGVQSLINACPRLTHLSVTGVPDFVDHRLQAFCRPPPPELNAAQRSIFCVYSGQDVANVRAFLKEEWERREQSNFYADRPLYSMRHIYRQAQAE
jgi:F-box and leucine-rich repeat protein GRR1